MTTKIGILTVKFNSTPLLTTGTISESESATKNELKPTKEADSESVEATGTSSESNQPAQAEPRLRNVPLFTKIKLYMCDM